MNIINKEDLKEDILSIINSHISSIIILNKQGKNSRIVEHKINMVDAIMKIITEKKLSNLRFILRRWNG